MDLHYRSQSFLGRKEKAPVKAYGNLVQPSNALTYPS
jgi:hypothetical protein